MQSHSIDLYMQAKLLISFDNIYHVISIARHSKFKHFPSKKKQFIKYSSKEASVCEEAYKKMPYIILGEWIQCL